eukprot:6441529-Amphidinium_carterae.1
MSLRVVHKGGFMTTLWWADACRLPSCLRQDQSRVRLIGGANLLISSATLVTFSRTHAAHRFDVRNLSRTLARVPNFRSHATDFAESTRRLNGVCISCARRLWDWSPLLDALVKVQRSQSNIGTPSTAFPGLWSSTSCSASGDCSTAAPASRTGMGKAGGGSCKMISTSSETSTTFESALAFVDSLLCRP